MTTTSQIFHHKPPNATKKLLYIMGSTWKTKNMFDLDMKEINFRQLLNDYGIETFTYDIPETSYEDFYSIAESLVQEHKIDNVMGYCMGGAVTLQLANKFEFNSITVIDVFRPLPKYKIYNEQTGRYECNKQQLLDCINKETKINDSVKAEYLDSLTDVISSPKYMTKQHMEPIVGHMCNKNYLANLKAKKKYLLWSSPFAAYQKEIFTGFGTKGYHASHWILLEEMRKELAKDLSMIVR
jgi:hypothetical protein